MPNRPDSPCTVNFGRMKHTIGDACLEWVSRHIGCIHRRHACDSTHRHMPCASRMGGSHRPHHNRNSRSCRTPGITLVWRIRRARNTHLVIAISQRPPTIFGTFTVVVLPFQFLPAFRMGITTFMVIFYYTVISYSTIPASCHAMKRR